MAKPFMESKQRDQRQIFYRSQLHLAVVYASVMGTILFGCGYVAHIAVNQSFNRMIDRELELLGHLIADKIHHQLEIPEKISLTNAEIVSSLCFPKKPCQSVVKELGLQYLFNHGYYVRFLSLSGKAIAAIHARSEQFPDNLNLMHSYDVRDEDGSLYHLHLLPLRTVKGELWGYLQVGQSVQQLDNYMNSLHWLISIGIPISIISIGLAAWWLAGWALQPIQIAYRQIEQFTADAAHELRTPISASQSILETALDDPELTENNQRKVLEALGRQIKRLRDLTQDLLILSRLERVGIESNLTEICLNELVEDVAEELMPLAMRMGINLDTNLLTEHSIYIKGDAPKIYRLLLNLVSNGIQYTPSGSVTIDLWNTDKQVTVSVKDTGVGIAPEHLPHIFERFYRVDNDRARHTGGSGLGLAISLAIAKAHKGQLTVSSKLQRGSEFKITLPLAQVKYE